MAMPTRNESTRHHNKVKTRSRAGFGLRTPSPISAEKANLGLRISVRTQTASAVARYPRISGDDFEEATPDPIPNSEVKLFGADGTARVAVWESRTSPGFFYKRQKLES